MKTRNKKTIITFALVLFVCTLFFSPAFAGYGLKETAGAADLQTVGGASDVQTLIGNVIGTALSLISVVFFALMLYGGFMWMTARGNTDQTRKALDTIIAAVIGITVVLGAYALTRFVFTSLGGTGGEVGTSVSVEGDSNREAGGAGTVCTNNEQCQSKLCVNGACTDPSGGVDYCALINDMNVCVQKCNSDGQGQDSCQDLINGVSEARGLCTDGDAEQKKLMYDSVKLMLQGSGQGQNVQDCVR